MDEGFSRKRDCPARAIPSGMFPLNRPVQPIMASTESHCKDHSQRLSYSGFTYRQRVSVELQCLERNMDDTSVTESADETKQRIFTLRLITSAVPGGTGTPKASQSLHVDEESPRAHRPPGPSQRSMADVPQQGQCRGTGVLDALDLPFARAEDKAWGSARSRVLSDGVAPYGQGELHGLRDCPGNARKLVSTRSAALMHVAPAGRASGMLLRQSPRLARGEAGSATAGPAKLNWANASGQRIQMQARRTPDDAAQHLGVSLSDHVCRRARAVACPARCTVAREMARSTVRLFCSLQGCRGWDAATGANSDV
ncbi:uncharacterized protein RHO25_009655 [Cercospora beticola]|uniref:Uncharacterized protein n=1 Tax=Cercospora beticola TaxID=122368 RepID=A0ABZ0NZH5_CERBT|nr:hypothetical protein RHO25_009655 [Cercospora beticola]